LISVPPSNLLRSDAAVSNFKKRFLWFTVQPLQGTLLGNALADIAAKAMTCQRVVKIMAVALDGSSWPDVNHPRKLYQLDVTNEEKEQWR